MTQWAPVQVRNDYKEKAGSWEAWTTTTLTVGFEDHDFEIRGFGSNEGEARADLLEKINDYLADHDALNSSLRLLKDEIACSPYFRAKAKMLAPVPEADAIRDKLATRIVPTSLLPVAEMIMIATEDRKYEERCATVIENNVRVESLSDEERQSLEHDHYLGPAKSLAPFRVVRHPAKDIEDLAIAIYTHREMLEKLLNESH